MAQSNVNPLIKLSPTFTKNDFKGEGGGRSTFQHKDVTTSNVKQVITNLQSVLDHYKDVTLFDDVFATITYKTIIAKSRITKRIFSYQKKDPFELIVGSKYLTAESTDSFSMKHQITFYVSVSNIEATIEKLNDVCFILDEEYNGIFKDSYFLDKKEKNIFENHHLSKTAFYDLICDISVIENIFVMEANVDVVDNTLVTLFSVFKSVLDLKDFLHKIGIDVSPNDIYDENNVFLRESYKTQLLLKEAPFLISQAIVKVDELFPEYSCIDDSNDICSIDAPKNEPVIGVFDSYFDNEAYFKDWVEAVPSYEKGITISDADKEHGTKICSIIVDGPKYNQWLDDHCGNFKVKLFEVGLEKSINYKYIYDNLEKIISENKHIKVWNFSIGSKRSINQNQVSLMAERIDYISKKYNVIFVISGTNINSDFPNDKHVGSPADSLNAIVVNSVDRNNKPANYTRTGPVLTLYTKPDVSYYGGVDDDEIIAYCKNPNRYKCKGTSFAAPWISRKLAYLIYYMHLDPIVAKALIIDVAAGWNKKQNEKEMEKIGYGVVPIDINKILKCDSDEIRFYVSDVTLGYTTILTTIPVPFDKTNLHFNYTAKATLCYYAPVDRKKGVDYCTSEMDLKFGRNEEKIDSNNLPYYVVDSIDHNRQNISDSTSFINNQQACLEFQKWNNTKHIVRPVTKGIRAIKPKVGSFWGLSITQYDRFEKRNQTYDKYNQKFGVVITLKEIKGNDAPVQSFVNDCIELKLKPIIVNDVYSVEIYNNENSKIEWKN